MRTSIRTVLLTAPAVLTMAAPHPAMAAFSGRPAVALRAHDDIRFVGIAAAMLLIVGLVGLIAQYLGSDDVGGDPVRARRTTQQDDISPSFHRVLDHIQEDDSAVVLLRTRKAIARVDPISQYDEDLRRDVAGIRQRFSSALADHARSVAGLEPAHAVAREEQLRALATRLADRLEVLTDEQSARDLARMQRRAERISSEVEA